MCWNCFQTMSYWYSSLLATLLNDVTYNFYWNLSVHNRRKLGCDVYGFCGRYIATKFQNRSVSITEPELHCNNVKCPTSVVTRAFRSIQFHKDENNIPAPIHSYNNGNHYNTSFYYMYVCMPYILPERAFFNNAKMKTLLFYLVRYEIHVLTTYLHIFSCNILTLDIH